MQRRWKLWAAARILLFSEFVRFMEGKGTETPDILLKCLALSLHFSTGVKSDFSSHWSWVLLQHRCLWGHPAHLLHPRPRDSNFQLAETISLAILEVSTESFRLPAQPSWLALKHGLPRRTLQHYSFPSGNLLLKDSISLWYFETWCSVLLSKQQESKMETRENMTPSANKCKAMENNFAN